jgi:predicted phosphoribosyltransferase
MEEEAMFTRFRNRSEAGRILAGRLTDYAGRGGVVARTLTRGGVPVAFEIAQALAAPLDVFIYEITPEPFYAVGVWYKDFAPTTDEKVRDLPDRTAVQIKAAS